MTTATIRSPAVSASTVTGSDFTAQIKAFDPFLRALTTALSLSCLFLIFVGGLVKSHEAGLSVPDWPTTYGENMFLFPYEKWIGGVFYEHGHRLLASGIGFITVCVALATFLRDQRRLPRVLSIVAVLTVIAQGVLGGLTVIYQLPPAISMSHGILAQTFFLITITLCYLQSRTFRSAAPNQTSASEARTIRRTAVIVIGVLYLQLFAGALMRHNGAGMALLDFPTMGGSWFPSVAPAVVYTANQLRAAVELPPTTPFAITLHLVHRLGGVVVALAVFWLFRVVHPLSTRAAITRRVGSLLLGLTLVQITLGVASILTIREPFLTSLHVATGAALLGSALLVLLTTYRESR
jgi:cytochrome c oxidase assembly protein subunit 15